MTERVEVMNGVVEWGGGGWRSQKEGRKRGNEMTK